MKKLSTTRVLIVLALTFILAWFFILPNLASSGRPTRKDRAFRRCLDYARFVQNASTNNHFIVKLTRLGGEIESGHFLKFVNLLSDAGDLALKGENYWIKTNCSGNHEIVIACDKQFDYDKLNPWPWNFFKRNYGYALGYSDGSVDIVSPEEYAKLDKHAFSLLSEVASNTLPIILAQ